jgi:hypothetical protein
MVGHVEKGLIDGNLLHQRRQPLQNRHHPPRHRRILAVARRHDEQRRAESQRLAHRHGGVDPQPPRRIGAGGDDAATFGPAADRKRLAAQSRVAQFLDRTEEGVEIEMDDLARAFYHSLNA